MQRLFVFLALCAWTGGGWAAALPPEINRILTAHGISPAAVSIVVQPVDAAKPLLSHLPDVSRNPASVMKLVTTWTALELLGPAYTWPTEVYFLGPVEGRTLDGDLAIKGYGDPFLVIENVWKMLRKVHGLGVTDITGNLLLDDSYFAVDAPRPGALDGQPFRTYNVVPDALLMNFQAVDFRVTIDSAHRRADVLADPDLPNLKVDNEIKLRKGTCGGYHYGVTFDVTGKARDRAVLGGRFPLGCQAYAYTFARAVLEPSTYAYGLFKMLWKETGGSFHGALRRGVVPPDATPVLTWRSPPLADVLRSINKFSNNLMARQVFYTLGAVQEGAPGTRAKGMDVIRKFLVDQGLDVSHLVMENGAGLSRDGRVTAAFMANLLRKAHAGAYAAEFISSLSLAGLDGTARRTFDDLPRVKGIHVKTGTLDQVSALAGYVRADNGQDYVVVVLMNGPDADRGYGHEIENATVRWVIGQARS